MAKRSKVVVDDENEKLTEVRHFRMSASGAMKWDEKVDRSGMTNSEFFREAVLNNQTTVRARPILHPVTREILHLLSKQSNNINQIARTLNTAKKSGEIDNRTYQSALSELAGLNEKAALVLSTI
jgi:Bacterial mobilisation protein (MobC)